MNDEFEITAVANNKELRVWTRNKLESAKVIADKAISDLGYEIATVINIFGGHKSSPLYIANVNSKETHQLTDELE